MPPHSPGAVVVVLEDDEAVQDVLGRMLRAYGLEDRRAASVHDLVAIAEREPIDAFIVDLRLAASPSGLDAITWLRAQPTYEEVPIIVLTGALVLTEVEEALITRNRAYMFYKPQGLPFIMMQLISLLERH